MGALKEWVILGITVMAFFILTKALASYLPDSGALGALKMILSRA